MGIEKMNNMDHRHIIISVSKNCFVKCPGCYNFFGKCNNLVTNDEILNFLYQLPKNKIEKITISGGDPLARENIVDLLCNIKKMGFKINLDTVGTRLLDDVYTIPKKEKLTKISVNDIAPFVDVLGIPLDGSNNAIVSTFRTGRLCIFDESIKLLEILKNHKIKICINTVVHKLNIDDLKNIADILLKYPYITKWQLFQFMAIGPMGYLNREKYNISDEAFVFYCQKIKKYLKDNKSPIILNDKSRQKRKNLYLLIDNDGEAWTPFATNENYWNDTKDENNKRIIVGNIKNKAEIDKIIEFIFQEEEK